MTKIQWMDKVIELDKYINMLDIVKTMDRGPVVSLWPKDDKYQAVRLKTLYSAQLWCYLSLRKNLFGEKSTVLMASCNWSTERIWKQKGWFGNTDKSSFQTITKDV